MSRVKDTPSVPLLERRRRLSGFRGRLGPAGDRGPTQRGDDGGSDGSGTRFDSASHLVAVSPWSDEKLLAKVREQLVPEMTRRGSIEVWIIDDTGFPKKGTHSVGVYHQYCGQFAKQANCQVAVTLSIANYHASLSIAYRLYLPREGLTIRPVVKRCTSQPRSGSRPSRRLR
jgi:hypothetical protein